MTTGRLLRYRVSAMGRRMAGPRTAAGALVGLLALSAAAATVWAVSGWAAADLGAGADDFRRRIGDRVFWLSALPVLVFAYTTFEVIFRAPDSAFVALLPLDGRLRWLDLQLRAYAVHAPLLLPALTYAGTVAWQGHTLDAIRLASVACATTILGIALCSWIHLMAGRTMLRVATPLSRSLSGAVVDDEAALILYAPAAGLGLTLLLVVFLDIVADRACRPDGQGEVLAVSCAALLAATVWVIRRAAQDARGCLPLVASRFQEVDTPMPYRDDGIPDRTAGDSLATRFAATTSALFLRDLRQLRRRHRLDRILLWVFVALAFRAALSSSNPARPLFPELLSLHVAFVGLFWTNAFRIHGRELGSPWLTRTLPLRNRPQHAASLTVDLLYPAWALLWAVIAALVTQHWVDAGLVAAWGSIVAVSAALLSRAVAVRTSDHSTAAAIAWRAAIVLGIALAPMGSP